MITEPEARMIGKAIREEANLIALAIHDPIEQRALCLRFAIDTQRVAMSLAPAGTAVEAASQVVEAARLYHGFLSEDAAVISYAAPEGDPS
jgi:hypothetical protein